MRIALRPALMSCLATKTRAKSQEMRRQAAKRTKAASRRRAATRIPSDRKPTAAGLEPGRASKAILARAGPGEPRDGAPTGTAAPDPRGARGSNGAAGRSEEHTSELQSLMRLSYAVFCLKKKKTQTESIHTI